MIIRDPFIDAETAARRYAATQWDEPRKVGTICKSPDAVMVFQLVGGTLWYAVRLLADYSGWEVGLETVHVDD